MKFYAAQVLALCASSSAFTIPSPKTSFALHATPEAAEVPVPAPGKPSWALPSISPVKRVEGESRHTFNFGDISQEVVQVAMETNGRPMNADIEVWIGPDWTPMKLKTYCDDGLVRPVQALVGTRNKAAQVEIRNTGPYEFPLDVACSYAKGPLTEIRSAIPAQQEARYVEGGAIYSIPFDPSVDQVQVLLNTDTRQLNTVVELLNGPNNIKQQYEIFTNNGLLNSLYVVFNTPGSGNTVRIKNLAPLEFPCKAFVSAV